MTENIFAIATDYLLPGDYLFHDYSASGILENDSLPQVKYLKFLEWEQDCKFKSVDTTMRVINSLLKCQKSFLGHPKSQELLSTTYYDN